MTGGLLQLVAYGAQDIYLTGNPLITYFKTVYRRHTNFAMQSMEQSFNTSAGFGKEVTSIISRDGDLMSGAYIKATLPDLVNDTNDSNDYYVRWTDDIGHYLIQWVELKISGQTIDRQYGEWLEIWSQLTLSLGQIQGYREMIGQDPRGPLNLNSGLQRDRAVNETIPGKIIIVPLQFWFCRNVGLSLPLIALQHSEVSITIKFQTSNKLVASFDVNGNSGASAHVPLSNIKELSNVSLWIDYILLDTEERRRFAQIAHEYLIEQVQYNGENYYTGDSNNDRSVTIDLNFEHPVKELIWVCQYTSAVRRGHVQWSNYTDRSAINYRNINNQILDLSNLGTISIDADTTGNNLYATNSINIQAVTSGIYANPNNALNPVIDGRLFLNNDPRIATQSGTYFNMYVPLRHHTSIPVSKGINVYNFSINPEKHQPSGTCNFSRLHSARLKLTLRTGENHNILPENNALSANFKGSDTVVRVYAVNYNILRIMSGMGGVAYRE